MNNKDNKNVNEQEKLLDHLIEYGGRQYIKDEIKKYEDIPELEPSKEFDEKMNRMFKDAYKQEVRHENLRLGKKIAVIAIAAVGVVSAAAMNIKAVREPVLNFVFHTDGNENKAGVKINKDSTDSDFLFNYLPSGYSHSKTQSSDHNKQLVYTFNNKSNDCIYINIQQNAKYENYVNQSSDKNYEKIIQNNKTYFFLKAKQNTLLFYKNGNIYSITSTQPESTLIKIAENIKHKK